jgi:hypothetical protein
MAVTNQNEQLEVMSMREFTMIVLFITFMVYTLNITGFSFKKFVLVESCVKDEPIDIAF